MHGLVSRRFRSIALLFAIAFVMLSAADVRADQTKITMILATGGTIAGKQATAGQPGYVPGEDSVKSLIEAVPETSGRFKRCSTPIEVLQAPQAMRSNIEGKPAAGSLPL